jgi:hypothetical protein
VKVYSYSEARQQLAELLNRASREGAGAIRRRDGHVFLVRPASRSGSPLDVPAIDAGLSRDEILALVRDSRRSTARYVSGRRAQSRQHSAHKPE